MKAGSSSNRLSNLIFCPLGGSRSSIARAHSRPIGTKARIKASQQSDHDNAEHD
jgi:hypothetical protein